MSSDNNHIFQRIVYTDKILQFALDPHDLDSTLELRFINKCFDETITCYSAEHWRNTLLSKRLHAKIGKIVMRVCDNKRRSSLSWLLNNVLVPFHLHQAVRSAEKKRNAAAVAAQSEEQQQQQQQQQKKPPAAAWNPTTPQSLEDWDAALNFALDDRNAAYSFPAHTMLVCMAKSGNKVLIKSLLTTLSQLTPMDVSVVADEADEGKRVSFPLDLSASVPADDNTRVDVIFHHPNLQCRDIIPLSSDQQDHKDITCNPVASTKHCFGEFIDPSKPGSDDLSIDRLTPLAIAVARGDAELIDMLFAAEQSILERGFFIPEHKRLARSTSAFRLEFPTTVKTKQDVVAHARRNIFAPVHVAARTGDIAVMQQLIRHGCDATAATIPLRPMTDSAERQQHFDTLSGTVNRCMTVAMYAAYEDRAEFLEWWLKEHGGGDDASAVSAQDSRGLSALHFAALAGSASCIRVLAKFAPSFDANARTAYGDTPLMVAASRAHTLAVRALLKAGADPNAEREDSGVTALLLAYSVGSEACVRLLLAAGAKFKNRKTGAAAAADAPSNDDNALPSLLPKGVTAFTAATETPAPERHIRRMRSLMDRSACPRPEPQEKLERIIGGELLGRW